MQTTLRLFYDACLTGDLPTVQRVCELNELAMRMSGGRWSGDFCVSAEDSRCIRLAAEAGQLAVLRYLCDLALAQPILGLDPAAWNNQALNYAARQGRLPIVQYLCELPEVDPARVLQVPLFLLRMEVVEAARAAVAQRSRWNPARAAWVGAVAAAGTYNQWSR